MVFTFAGDSTITKYFAHTIIDRFDETLLVHTSGRPITEATINELAVLLDINE